VVAGFEFPQPDPSGAWGRQVSFNIALSMSPRTVADGESASDASSRCSELTPPTKDAPPTVSHRHSPAVLDWSRTPEDQLPPHALPTVASFIQIDGVPSALRWSVREGSLLFFLDGSDHRSTNGHFPPDKTSTTEAGA
jgi:hypothetical protein